MNKSFIFKLALTNMFSKKMRTILTVGGMGISLGMIFFLVGLGNGIQKIITDEVTASESMNVVSITSKRTKQLKLSPENLAKIKSVSGIGETEEVINLSGKINYHDTKIDVPVYAVSDGFFEVTPVNFTSGQAFSTENKGIVINSVVAKALGLSVREAVNKKIVHDFVITKDLAPQQEMANKEVKNQEYKIVGVLEKGSTPLVYVPIEDINKMGATIDNQIKVMVTNPDKIKSIRESIEQMGFETKSIRDTIDQVTKIFGLIKWAVLIVGLVTLVIATFGTLNTVTMTLVEQTREIGFLRLLGIEDRDVKNLFIIQALTLVLGGIAVGIFITLALGFIVNLVFGYMTASLNIDDLSVYQIPFLFIIEIIVFSLIFGFSIGLFPAKRAVKISPLEALRY